MIGFFKLKICPECQGVILYDEIKKAVVFTLGKMINGIFYGEKSYYYHKECVINEKILLYP